jgi:hypothetical protein
VATVGPTNGRQEEEEEGGNEEGRESAVSSAGEREGGESVSESHFSPTLPPRERGYVVP